LKEKYNKGNMILAVDVQYSENNATVAGVEFENWHSDKAQKEYVSWFEGVADYEPGSFFKRELPCILRLLSEHNLKPDCIIVDGLVFLDGYSKAGLGKHLFDALDEKTTVIGVAKKRFKNIDMNFAVYRGDSQRPIYVTSIGTDIELAKENIRNMHGQHRLPTLLKRADQICRGINTG
jgi:deoxyribonuclease V